MQRLPFIFLYVLFVQACGQKAATGPEQAGENPASTESFAPSPYLNDIQLTTSGGLQISRGHLSNSRGHVLPKNNRVKTGDTVILNLFVKAGWSIDNGVVLPGASQSIITGDGEPVTQPTDLFSGRSLTLADASFIRLQTVITKTRPDIDSFEVRFRVWDKNGTGRADGFYRLALQKQ